MKKVVYTILTLSMIISISSCKKDKEKSKDVVLEFTDQRDGNIYKYKKIGDEYWMLENLRFDPVEGRYHCNNDKSTADKFGFLYNWEVAYNVCPAGWHIPTQDEWTNLINNLGGENIAGGKLKQSGSEYWQSPNTGATNESDFNALPGGYHLDNFAIGNMGFKGYNTIAAFWTGTNISSTNIWCLRLQHDSCSAEFVSGFYKNAHSIRCVKDD